jgi:fibronectin-binding autotransporter adhesin
MNRQNAYFVLITAAAATVAAGKAQGQTVTLYAGPPAYNTTSGNGYRNPTVVTRPGMTAGNGAGIGDAGNYSSGSFLAKVAYRIDSTGNVTFLQAPSADSTNTIPYAINATGTAVGSSDLYDSSGDSLGVAALSWNASGGVTQLSSFGTNPNSGQTYGAAYAINSGGVSTGYQYGYNTSTGSVVTSQYATRWDAAGNVTALSPLNTSPSGSSTATGYAINDSGTVVGSALLYASGSSSTLGTRPALWAGSGTAVTALGILGTDTGTASGSTSGAAYAVNASGVSVGNVAAFNSTGGALGTAPARWDASGNVTQLGTLGVSASNGQFAGYALSVNSTGTAVGYSVEYNNVGASLGVRATVWPAGSAAVTELPNLGVSGSSTTTSYSYSINDVGLIVGSALAYNSGAGSVPHSTLWIPSASAPSGYTVTDLNSLLSTADASKFVLNSAYSISNTDWVTALATYVPTNTQEEVLLHLVFNPANLTWNNTGGTGDGTTWDTAQKNWNNGTGVVSYSDNSNNFTLGDNVTFNDTNDGNYSVSIPGVVHPTSVTINNSLSPYIFNGTGGIAGPTSLTKLGSSSLTLTTSNTYTGGTAINAGVLILNSATALPANSSLTIASGAQVTIANHSAGAPYVPTVTTLANSGTIDISNNAMVITGGSYGTINAEAGAGYGNGSWAGTNGSSGVITSSVAAGDTSHLTAVGVATGFATFEGSNVSSTSVLVKYTYYGDTNLDGHVDGSDYSRIDGGYLGHLSGWDNGDFNFDGVVDGSDYTLMDNAFNTQGVRIAAELAQPDAVPTAQIADPAAVPEPPVLGLLGVGVMALLCRRGTRRASRGV